MDAVLDFVGDEPSRQLVTGSELLAGAGELLAAAPAAPFHAPHRSLPPRSVAHAWTGDPAAGYVLTTRA